MKFLVRESKPKDGWYYGIIKYYKNLDSFSEVLTDMHLKPKKINFIQGLYKKGELPYDQITFPISRKKYIILSFKKLSQLGQLDQMLIKDLYND